MNQQSILINSEQKSYEMFAEPVHCKETHVKSKQIVRFIFLFSFLHLQVPLVIGNETFIITWQDQRNIIDRRNWFLSRPPNATPTGIECPMGGDQTAMINYQSLLAQILHELRGNDAAFESNLPPGRNMDARQCKPFCFHYEKKTDTEDLPYYQNRDRLRASNGERVVKHVHYYVESAVKSVGTNTFATDQPMETEEITDIEDLEL